MPKVKFERDKPHINIGTLGNINLGYTSLAAAITKVLAEAGLSQPANFENIDAKFETPAQGTGINPRQFGYETENRRYTHIDLLDLEAAKSLITGATHLDGAILVVSAAEGPTRRTHEHIVLARQVGIPTMVVFLNEADRVEDEETLELVEMEIREALSRHDFDGDSTPIIRGSAAAALSGSDEKLGKEAILELMAAVDASIPQPERPLDKPFMMAIEDVFSLSGRGTVVTGRIETGTVRVGDEVEIVGIIATRRTIVVGIERFRSMLAEGRAGENVGILLRGVGRDEVERGQVLAKPGTVFPHTEFRSEVYVLGKDEGGRREPFFANYRPKFYFRTTDVVGTIELPEGREMVMPGENVVMGVKLLAPIALDVGQRFAIREGRRTVGAGVVTSVAASGYRQIAASGDVSLEIEVDEYDGPTGEDNTVVPDPEDGGPPLGTDGQYIGFLFATCRQADEEGDEVYDWQRLENAVNYGWAQVRVPEERRFGTLRRPWKLPILEIEIERENSRKHFIVNDVRALPLDQWKTMAAEHGAKEALVFVHGFNTSFKAGLYRAAQIFWDLQYTGVPVLFSWASAGHVVDYPYDYDSADHGSYAFCEMLTELADAAVTRIHVIAHSMGNQLVLSALERHNHTATPLGIAELMMAAPDVDRHAYLRRMPALAKAVPGLTLYASSKDKALKASKKARRDVQRAGDIVRGSPLLVPGVDTIDISAIGAEIFGLGHGAYAKSRSILNDIGLLIRSHARPPNARLVELRGMPVGATPPRWWRFAD